MTPYDTSGMRLPAEWETHECVMLAWPHEDTDWLPILPEARACIAAIIRAIANVECVAVVGPASKCIRSFREQDFDSRRVRFFDIPTNDTWARDFGAITLLADDGKPSTLDFKFNGWGLKFASDLDNLVNTRLANVMACPIVNHLSFVLEGGSVESDGQGTILTTSQCLLSKNRNGGLKKEEIEKYVCQALGARRMLWLDHGALAGDDTDSHIDTLARLAPDNTILYVGAGEEDSANVNHDGLEAMLAELRELRTPEGMPYNLIELPLPDPVRDPDDGHLLPATYANFLIAQGAVLVPVYGQHLKDTLACQTIASVFHDRMVVPVDCNALVRQHGSLHCVTMQFPAGVFKDIKDNQWQ